MSLAIFTIVSNNYFAFAKTLMDSVIKNHPEAELFVLICDKWDEEIGLYEGKFKIVNISEIGANCIDSIAFKYNILEFNTSVKPFMFNWLFNKKDYKQIIYLDPDIFLFSPLKEAIKLLNSGASIVLTPHLTSLLNDSKKPSELDIIKSGVYNLGFLALSRHIQTNSFLNWWMGKLEENCVIDLENGIFVDQKWIDLVPAIFNDVYILKHEGYNVAYWNLAHRKISKSEQCYHINERYPLVFFHFSGINPNNYSNVSKHQNRFNAGDLPFLSELLAEYSNIVLGNGHKKYLTKKYGFSSFNDGTPINDIIKCVYSKYGELRELCERKPLEKNFIFSQLSYEKNNLLCKLPLITYVMYEIWSSRKDLSEVFPDIFGKDRISFCSWFIESAEREYGFTKPFLEPVKNSLSQINKDNNSISFKRKESLKNRIKRKIQKKVYKTGLVIKPYIKKIIPEKLYEKLKEQHKTIFKSSFTESNQIFVMSNKVDKYIGDSGINLVGYTQAVLGIGQACRVTSEALIERKIPFGVIPYTMGCNSPQNDTSLIAHIEKKPRYKGNLFFINADQMNLAYSYFGKEFFSGKYNIGFWAWELPEFPDVFQSGFSFVNEVWTFSRFVTDSISEKSPVPVLYVPLPIAFKIPERKERRKFGLPEDKFLFLSMYDVFSIKDRKNPEGAISAFKKAFKPNDDRVGLVIKIINSERSPMELEILKDMVKGYNNIYFVTDVLERKEIISLFYSIDAFISLHRAEGFGLVMAETMYVGKAVIGTNWSGNIDFMKENNSCLVDYKLVRIGKDLPPYEAHQYWAEPNIETASEYLVKLVEDREYYIRISENSKKTISQMFSPEKVGQIIEKRLRYLGIIN